MKPRSRTKGSTPSTTPTTASKGPTNSGGELSPIQRGILASIRRDGPGTEAEIYRTVGRSLREKTTMAGLRDDLAELESRLLVKCMTQPNGRRIWGMP